MDLMQLLPHSVSDSASSDEGDNPICSGISYEANDMIALTSADYCSSNCCSEACPGPHQPKNLQSATKQKQGKQN